MVKPFKICPNKLECFIAIDKKISQSDICEGWEPTQGVKLICSNLWIAYQPYLQRANDCITQTL
jgi:hypothetical protein